MNKYSLLFLLTLVPVFLFPSSRSDSLVNSGWSSWGDKKMSEAETLFLSAIKEDANDARAFFSLSYIYSIQNKHDKAWEVYKKGIDRSVDAYPYIFAGWATEKLRQHSSPKEAGIIDMLVQLTKDVKAAGKLQAAAYAMLGDYHEKHNRLDESKKYYDNIRSISQWQLIGPFENISASGYDNVFPPEREFDVRQSYEGKNDVRVSWFRFKTIRNDRWIDFTRYFGNDNSIYYANMFVRSKSKQKVQVRVGTSGSLKTFLNDELIIAVRDENNNDLDTYIAETELQEGWNRVLVKCGYSEITNCNFMFRLTDPNGFPLTDLEITTEPRQYIKTQGVQSVMLENFAERYFKDRIVQYPEHAENYLLLSETYLRNDKALEAEEIIRQLIKKLPQCAIVYSQLIEVYARGEKGNEIGDIFEKLVTIDPSLPNTISFRYYQSVANEDFDNAEKFLRQYELLLPGHKDLYELYIDFYSKKKQTDRLIVYANEAYTKYPGVWQFANLRAAIVLQTQRKYEPAIEVIENFLRKEYSTQGVYALAEMHLRANNLQQFEQTFNRLFELTPTAPGYYLQLAEVYIQVQQYDKAEAAVKKALEITPSSSVLFERLGKILMMKDNKEGAKQAFRDALLSQPTRYESRENLRELEAKPSIFSTFPTSDIRQIILQAPDADKFPEDAAIILLDDTKRVVYPEGASEYLREVIVKVFNNRGVDFFKEYNVGYNSYSETLIIEKAIVVKKDWSETKADVNGNQIVFKSLEEGDIIHIKWKVKNFYNGKLSQHFWDKVSFNGFLPIAKVKYSLLVPKGKQFNYQMQHSSITPTIDSLSDGILFTWKNIDVPSLEYEQNMPDVEDIGAILHISSIPSWEYIVQWYLDLAKEKTRSSFEISELAKELFVNNPNPTESEKIRVIYDYITEKIRYSNVSFRQSAYIPQSARNVVVHKLGDCKDVATACIALLNEVGIKAYHVLVNTRDQGFNKYVLPSIAFNHCVVAAETKEGMKYFDLTAFNYPAGSIPRSDQYAFALTIKPGETKPFYLDPANFLPRLISRTQFIEMQEGNTAIVTKEALRTGSAAGSYRETYRNLGKKDQEKELSQSISDEYPTVKILLFTFENLDSPEQSISSKYSFSVENYATVAGGLTIVKNIWTDRFYAREALSYEKRDFAYYFYPGLDTVRENLTISVPKGLKPIDLKPKTVIKSKFGEYSVNFSFAKNQLKGNRTMIFFKEIIEPSEYAEFKKFYNDIRLEDERNIIFKK